MITLNLKIKKKTPLLNITTTHHVTNMLINVVSFLLGKSPASVYYCMLTFRNSLSVPSSKAVVEH